MNIMLGVILYLAAFAAAPAFAVPIFYTALLNGANEGTITPGIGSATITIDTTAHTMRVQGSFSGLTSGTTASHIHCCTTSAGTGTIGVATTTPTFPNFPLGVTAGTYDQTLDLTSASTYNPAFVTANGGSIATAEQVLSNGMAAGTAYFNIHTSVFPGGEIRGFLELPPVLTSAISRKTHTGAGVFDLPLPATPTNPATEPRSTGGSHSIVFTFNKAVVAGNAVVSEGVATSGAPTFNGNEMIVPLSAVADHQYVTVTVGSVTASDGAFGGTGSVRVGF